MHIHSHSIVLFFIMFNQISCIVVKPLLLCSLCRGSVSLCFFQPFHFRARCQYVIIIEIDGNAAFPIDYTDLIMFIALSLIVIATIL